VKINSKVCYSVRMMTDIASQRDGGPVPLKDVAERQGLSRPYLAQLAAPLRNASLLRSVWGNRGGYVLGRPAREITLLEIIEAVDGPIRIVDCLGDADFCDHVESCEWIGVWQDINDSITRTLEHYTLEDAARLGVPKAPTFGGCPVIHKH